MAVGLSFVISNRSHVSKTGLARGGSKDRSDNELGPVAVSRSSKEGVIAWDSSFLVRIYMDEWRNVGR